MSFFKNIFGKSSSQQEEELQKSASVTEFFFGRYTDANKPIEKTREWDKAVIKFDNKEFLESFEHFFNYLRDDKVNNVQYTRNGNQISFELMQGSNLVKGTADNQHFVAEAEIAHFNQQPGVALMRLLMSNNYTLSFCRFAINENTIVLKFDCPAYDAAPRKLYFALKELATKADKQDDVLLAEFETLQRIQLPNYVSIPEAERTTKKKFLKLWIEAVLKRCSELDEEKFSGAISYLLLGLCFRIDYLIRPEGKLMNDVEKITYKFYQKDNKSYVHKNRQMIEDFENILNNIDSIPDECFINVRNTFGLVPPASHQQVYDFILAEFPQTQWYKQNNYPDIVIAIYEYIIGYCFYSFGMYEASMELLHLLFRIIHQDFFNELGFPERYYDKNNNVFQRTLIEKTISDIIAKHKKTYPRLDFKITYIKYYNMEEFLYSYLNEFTYLNYYTQQ